MSGQSWAIYIDPIGEALRAALWANLKESLGLKTCMQGDLMQTAATPDEWANLLPAIFIKCHDGELLNVNPGNWGEFIYHFSVTFIRQQNTADGVPYRIAQQAVTTIINSLCTDGADFTLDALDGTPGLDMQHVFPRKWDFATDLTLEGIDFLLSIGVINVEIKADSIKFTP